MSLPRIKLNIPNTNNNNNIETTNSTEERDPLIENSIILRVSNNLQQGLLSQSKDTNLIELLNYDDALTIQYFGLRKLVVIIDLNKLGLEGKEIYACELLDLPTITEVYKTTDLGKNMVKNGNITQVIYIYKKINTIEEVFSLQFDKICHDEVLLTSENPVDPIYNDFYEKEYNETLKMYESLKRLDFKNKKKYEQLIPTLIQNKENLVIKPTVLNSFYKMCKNGLTPPLHNVARRRQRKQLSLEEIQKLDFTLNRLVEKDMAAESVEFEFVSESEINDNINNHSIGYGTPNYNSSSVDYNNQLKQSHSNMKNIVADGERDELKNKLKDVIQQQKPISKNDSISDDEDDDGEEEEEEEEEDEEEEESDLEMELEKALLESPGSTTTSQINGKTEKVLSKNADSLESNTEDVDGLFSDDDNESNKNEKGNKTENGNIAEDEDDEEEEGDDDDDDELAGLLEELNSLQAVKQKNIKSFDSCKNQFMKERIMDRIKKIDKEISVLESKVRIVRGGGLQSSDDSEEEEEEEEEEEQDVEGEDGDGKKTDKPDGKQLLFGGAADNDQDEEENENNNDFMNQMNSNTDNGNDDLDLDMLRANSNDNKDNSNDDNADDIDMSLFQ
ncbi:hypothetical protein HANVADRAFT_55037 [Hanseniaspora valbyensis NRRL Y-1626]|uniref:TAFII55 protein conserved region domain-containing protein n=1 Tax=Hanseniaspora valbyensis NRRL Y-1626 TaxID=766949 RepID=A0A1B7THY2_9ASCO|nr:hypothetical protein HANVADRAFT_55037 [Hanseniaspora valbyensis NRRL Y-1626]